MKLPVCNMEQEIVEAIGTHDVIILCGETGSGKSTQVKCGYAMILTGDLSFTSYGYIYPLHYTIHRNRHLLTDDGTNWYVDSSIYV